ncbi:short-chain dehydrogenase [beta proteobacterium AAP99]|nr:short-chain dehydrogenase [beta proteobacterium AAP99]
MSQALYIITGSSRGLGLGMAQEALAQGHRVLGLARQQASALQEHCEQWTADLAQPLDVAARLEAWLAQQPATDAVLINNAALLTDPGPSDAVPPLALSTALRVGLEAPLLLTAAFLRATAKWQTARKVVLISSGLGRRAMAGSAPYCAQKAGLDHFARAAALDEAIKPNGARIVSLAPGVIDTDMQVQLRSATGPGFPDRNVFADYHASGRLASPQAAAQAVLRYVARSDFGANPVADVRDA